MLKNWAKVELILRHKSAWKVPNSQESNLNQKRIERESSVNLTENLPRKYTELPRANLNENPQFVLS